MTPPNHVCTQQNKIDRLERAIFGDDFAHEVGMKEKVDDMHKLLTEGNAIKKFIIKMFVATTAIAGLIYTFIQIDKEGH